MFGELLSASVAWLENSTCMHANTHIHTHTHTYTHTYNKINNTE